MGDLPDEYYTEHDVEVVYLSYLMDGVNYDGDNRQDVGEFYDKMRKGSMPVTSQLNPEGAKKKFVELLAKCRRILCIAFSGGLSGTCNNFMSAAEEVMQEYDDCEIAVVDSLCASLGQGLLIHKAVCLRDQGCSFEETKKWVEENRLNVVHNFTVDDLFHLHRGGRVSKATAIMGSLINIKPMLHVDNEGHLVAVGKARGRKKSIQELEKAMEKQVGSWKDKNDIVFISHGDCLEDAQYLADLIRKRTGIDSFLINYVGPTIGAHSGPGTLALFYMGDVR